MSGAPVTLSAHFLNLPKPKIRIIYNFFYVEVKREFNPFVLHARVPHHSGCFKKNLSRPAAAYTEHVSNFLQCLPINNCLNYIGIHVAVPAAS